MSTSFRWLGLVAGLGILAGFAACQQLDSGTARGSPQVEGRKEAAEPAAKPNHHALLIGVGRYPNLAEKYQLQGPPNDVVLLGDLLKARFGFDPKNIATLSDAAGEHQPTYKNIKREFEKLAGKEFKSGDQVVILLSGHGMQIPDQEPPQRDDPEPDGMDEAFLPADVEVSPDKTTIPNAIRDDELRQWLKPLTDKGAFVCLIADCCHSGTVLRASDREVPRKIEGSDLGLAKKAVPAVRSLPGGAFKVSEKSDKLVGIYACRSVEQTIELELPERDPKPKMHGLLTYTLCETLRQAPAGLRLTYAQLVQRIEDHYKTLGRTWPTPLAEGQARNNREVFGTAELRPITFSLTRNAAGHWVVNAGRLDGLTEQSVLAVYEDGKADKRVGHVKITTARVSECDVVPCEFDPQPLVKDLPSPARCEPVYIDYGDLKLAVAVAAKTTRGTAVADAERQKWTQEIRKLEEEKGSVVKAFADPNQAKWLVTVEEGKAYLVPDEGVVIEDDKPTTAKFGPYEGEQAAAKLKQALGKITRARHLVALGKAPEGLVSASSPKVRVEVVKFKNENDQEGTVVKREGPTAQLQPGDIIAFRVHNESRNKIVYPTVLFVDAGAGIQCAYPGPGEVIESLAPGKSLTSEPWRLKDDHLGVEHAVVLAVQADKPVDFSRFEQESLAKAKGVGLRGGSDGMDTPLGKLLQYAMYGEDTGIRGGERVVFDRYAVDRFHWHTLKPAGAPNP